MKKPTSLYLNELLANRVARHLERALDGHGSLGGFFGWVAEQARAALLEGGYKGPYLIEEQVRWLEALEGTAPDMEEYRAAWEAFTAHLPWHRTHPAASHVLALFALKQISPLWNRPRGQLVHNLRVLVEDQLTRDLLEEFAWAAEEPSSQDTAASDEKSRQVYLLWFKDRLEILGGRPRPQAISVYVEPEAHGALLQAFQNTFFDRLLGTLDDLLAGPWPSAGALLAFLERPEGYFTTAPVVRITGGSLVELGDDIETIDWFLEHLGYCVISEMKEPHVNERYALRVILKNYALDWPALGKLVQRFGKDAVRKMLERVVTSSYELGIDALYYYWVDASVWLAMDLGLLDSPFQDGAELRARAIGHLVARYGLSEFRPERRLAYRVLRERVQGERVRDPLEFHVLRLLQAYALAVLPEEEREPSRVSQPMLGLLGQAGLFPVRDTLELWTGLRVRVDGPEHWRLYKGRKLWRTLSSAEAAWVAHFLEWLLPLTHDLLAVRWSPHFANVNCLLEPGEVRAVYLLGPEVLDLALQEVVAELNDPDVIMAATRRLAERLRQQGRFQGAVQKA